MKKRVSPLENMKAQMHRAMKNRFIFSNQAHWSQKIHIIVYVIDIQYPTFFVLRTKSFLSISYHNSLNHSITLEFNNLTIINLITTITCTIFYHCCKKVQKSQSYFSNPPEISHMPHWQLPPDCLPITVYKCTHLYRTVLCTCTELGTMEPVLRVQIHLMREQQLRRN